MLIKKTKDCGEKRMLYIIGGTSRSGKTTISRKILSSRNISYLSLDWLVMGFTNGIPEYGINDKLFPNEIAVSMWSFTKAMCETMIWQDVDYVIEGEAILPEHVSELMKNHPGQVKACYVGYTEIEIDQKVKDVKTFSEGPKDWLSNEPEEYIISHIRNMLKYSQYIKEQCDIYQIKYFDTSHHFMETLDEAIQFLTQG
jgi:2-phosphoglycerate kinase